ncbi:hypothetical protein Vretimale_9897, partial [Volvox reticuliferus]
DSTAGAVTSVAAPWNDDELDKSVFGVSFPKAVRCAESGTGEGRATSTGATVARTAGSRVIGRSCDGASVLIEDALEVSPPVVRGRYGISGKGRINEEGPMLAHFTGGHRRPYRTADEVVVPSVVVEVAVAAAVPLHSWGLGGGFRGCIPSGGAVFCGAAA